MDDRERIEALAADGRITREEADRLLGVLDDIDQTEQQLGGVDTEVRNQQVGEGADASRDGSPAAPTPPGSPDAPAAPQPKQGGKSSDRAGAAPEGLKWVEATLLAGDLEIEVDDEATSPSAVSHGAGQTELERTESGYRFRGFSQKEDTFFGRLVSGLTRGETTLTIPRGWGLRVEMKAGDVSIHGPLRFLSGHLLAGDLDADEVHGIDLNVSAGDIDLALLITEGRNRLQAVAGDISVRLIPGSDAKVSGRVNIGDLSLPEGWTRKSRGIGSAFERTLGEGSGELSLELGTGDLQVELSDRHEEQATHG